MSDYDSKVNNILFLLGEGFNLVSVMISVIYEFFVLVDVVEHMT